MSTRGAADSDSEQQVTLPILRWTGHPFIDMGTATIAAFTGATDPQVIDDAALESFAKYVEDALRTDSIRSHASVLFTINTPYLQPSFSPERRTENAQKLLRAYAQSPDDSGEPCVYCGCPAFQADTRSGRLYREFIPMLTGQGVVNFAPYGQHGLSICGHCVVALQALVIGAPSCEGRALIVGADDPRQLIAIIGSDEWLGAIRRRIDLSRTTGKKVDTWKSPRSRLIDCLVALQRRSSDDVQPGGFTVFHASNSGQGPTIDVFPLAATVASFVRRAQAAAYLPGWRKVVRRQWRDERRRSTDQDPGESERVYWRNPLYEDLFSLPAEATRFVRRYLVGPELWSIRNARQRATIDTTPIWLIGQLFLEEVLGVDATRIESIRALGDALADEIGNNNDKPLARRVFRTTRYPAIRQIIIAANNRRIKRGLAPVLSFEGFLSVFEVGEELPRMDWHLAWDLALLRVIDRLHEQDWFGANPDAAQDLPMMDGFNDPSDDDDFMPGGAQ